MSKLTLLCGPPMSGKTAVGIKIAEELYYCYKKSVLFVSPDTVTPFMGLVFPSVRDKELFSLGELLEHTSVTEDNILRHTVTTPKMQNFGFLGYKAGENKFTYARATRDKVKEFFDNCFKTAEHIFLDCTAGLDDPLSAYALTIADNAVQLIPPDIRSSAYYASFEKSYELLKDKTIGAININDREIYLPVGEVKTGFSNAKYIIPYCFYLKQQIITGTLTERIPDPKFKAVCRGLAEAVL